jgi:hypothetical protein
VDLTLGREVPVTVEIAAAVEPKNAHAATASGTFSPLFPSSPSK